VGVLNPRSAPRFGGGAWVGSLAAATVGAALGAAAMRHVPPASLARALPPRAIVVAQPADCEARFTALAVVVRAAQQAQVPLEVLVPGNAQHRLAVTRALAGFGAAVRVQPASPNALRAVRALGYSTTPLLVVLDAQRRLRLAAPLPTTLEALRQWHTLVPAALGG
jgi:hypothetical protein